MVKVKEQEEIRRAGNKNVDKTTVDQPASVMLLPMRMMAGTLRIKDNDSTDQLYRPGTTELPTRRSSFLDLDHVWHPDSFETQFTNGTLTIVVNGLSLDKVWANPYRVPHGLSPYAF